MAICKNMRDIRLKKGLTQKQVAEACGTVDATIRMYELGKANPKPATVAKIARALDVPVAELYGLEWMPKGGMIDPEMESALYQSAFPGSDGTVPIDSPNEARLRTSFGRLNVDGQMEAIRRIEEMAHVPKYRLIGETHTAEKEEQLSLALHRLWNARFELSLMEQLGAAVCPAARSSKEIIKETEKEILDIQLNRFMCEELAQENMPLLHALRAYAAKEKGFEGSSMEVQGTEEAMAMAIRCLDITLHCGKNSRTWFLRYCPDLQPNTVCLTRHVFDGMGGLGERQGYMVSVIVDSKAVYDTLCSYHDTPEGKVAAACKLGGKVTPPPQGVSILYFDPEKGTLQESVPPAVSVS